jgi:hypothetical protein
MLVTLPILLLLLDVWPLRRFACSTRDAARLVREKWAFLIPTLAAIAMTIVDQRRIGALSTLEALPAAKRLANATVSYAAYLGKMAWPARLAVFYPCRNTCRGQP